MPLPTAPTRKPNNEGNRQANSKANNQLLLKGMLFTLIGLGMGVSPRFITSPELYGMVTTAALVGWGVLALGCALIGWYAWRRIRP
jgi:hypothetical protein